MRKGMPISLGFWEWGYPYHWNTSLLSRRSGLTPAGTSTGVLKKLVRSYTTLGSDVKRLVLSPSSFVHQWLSSIKHKGQERTGNNPSVRNVMIDKQTVVNRSIWNVWKKVNTGSRWRTPSGKVGKLLGVFERHTSTGSGLFALLSRDFEQIFWPIVSQRLDTWNYKFGSVKAYKGTFWATYVNRNRSKAFSHLTSLNAIKIVLLSVLSPVKKICRKIE